MISKKDVWCCCEEFDDGSLQVFQHDNICSLDCLNKKFIELSRLKELRQELKKKIDFKLSGVKKNEKNIASIRDEFKWLYNLIDEVFGVEGEK